MSKFPDFIENGDCMCFYIIIRIWLAFTWFFNGGRYIVCTCSESRFWTEKYFCAFFLVCVCKHRHYPFPNILFCMSRRWDAISFYRFLMFSRFAYLLYILFLTHTILCFLEEWFPIAPYWLSLNLPESQWLHFYCMYIGYNTRRLVIINRSLWIYKAL